jgi:hypothetical protein
MVINLNGRAIDRHCGEKRYRPGDRCPTDQPTGLQGNPNYQPVALRRYAYCVQGRGIHDRA